MWGSVLDGSNSEPALTCVSAGQTCQNSVQRPCGALRAGAPVGRFLMRFTTSKGPAFELGCGRSTTVNFAHPERSGKGVRSAAASCGCSPTFAIAGGRTPRVSGRVREPLPQADRAAGPQSAIVHSSPLDCLMMEPGGAHVGRCSPIAVDAEVVAGAASLTPDGPELARFSPPDFSIGVQRGRGRSRHRRTRPGNRLATAALAGDIGPGTR